MAASGHIDARTLAFLLLLGACNGGGASSPSWSKDPGPDDVVLVTGPFAIKLGELDRYVEWSKKIDPSLATAFIRRKTLEDFILKSRVVRQFVSADEIAKAKATAERIWAVVEAKGADVKTLREVGGNYPFYDDGSYSPPFNAFSPPLARTLWATDKGKVAAPVETVSSFVIAGVVDRKKRGPIDVRRIAQIRIAFRDSLLMKNVTDEISKLREGKAFVHPKFKADFEAFFKSIDTTPPPQLSSKSR